VGPSQDVAKKNGKRKRETGTTTGVGRTYVKYAAERGRIPYGASKTLKSSHREETKQPKE